MQPDIETILEKVIAAQSDILTIISNMIVADSNDTTALEGGLEALEEVYEELSSLGDLFISSYDPVMELSKQTVALALSTDPPKQAPLSTDSSSGTTPESQNDTPTPINAATGQPVPIATVLPNTL